MNQAYCPCGGIASLARSIRNFWDKVEKTNHCWLWIGSINLDGYGNFWSENRSEKAHRFSYLIHFGEIPKGKSVLHKCDNPRCVNPDHIYIGTQSDNMKDRSARGRIDLKGIKNPNCKLSTEQVLEIRHLRNKEKWTQSRIAKKFSIAQSHVSKLVLNMQRIDS